MKTMTEALKILSAPLVADDIEAREGCVNRGGVNVLLYKTSRVDIARLTQAFGLNFKIQYEDLTPESVLCRIWVYNHEIKEWVDRADVGFNDSKFYEEVRIKGKYTDAIKRAGFRWGIGNELYIKFPLFIKCPTVQNPRKNGSFIVDRNAIGYDKKLRVQSVRTINGEIVGISVGYKGTNYGVRYGDWKNDIIN